MASRLYPKYALFFTVLLFSSVVSAALPEIVAHRGGTGDGPENTMKTIENSKSITNNMWVSVQLSKDKKIVLYRPSDLKVLTNGQGKISEYQANELAKLDAGYNVPTPENPEYRGQGYTIPTLEDVLVKNPELRFFIDIKSPDADPKEMAKALETLIIGGNNQKRITLYSTEKKFLDALPASLAHFESRDVTRNALANITMTHNCVINTEENSFVPSFPVIHAFELRRNVEVVEKFTLGEGRSSSQLVWDDEAMQCIKQGDKAKVMLIGINTRDDYEQAIYLGADYVMVDSPKTAATWAQ